MTQQDDRFLHQLMLYGNVFKQSHMQRVGQEKVKIHQYVNSRLSLTLIWRNTSAGSR